MSFHTRKAMLGGTVAAAALIVATGAFAQARSFDLPSEEAAKAIPEFARQAGLQIIAPVSQLHGVRTTALRGSLDARAALAKLIAGTGLEVASDNGSVITLRLGGAASRPPAPAGGEAAQMEELVVTGSHLRRSSFDEPIPVAEVSHEDLMDQGYVDLADALTDIPGVDQGVNLATAQTAVQDNGLSTVNLRGLGDNRTLTLIDGHRAVSNAGSRNAVSLSSIPSFMIDRVEVSTGGASAVYGSDAVAGVVNIITLNKLNGVKVRVTGSGTDGGGGASADYTIAAGKQFLDGRLSILGGVSFDKQSILRATQRDFATRSVAYSSTTNTVTIPDLSTYSPGGYFLSGKYFYTGTQEMKNFNPAVDGYEDRTSGTLITPARNINGGFKIRYDVNRHLSFTADFQASQVTTDSVREPLDVHDTSAYGVDDQFSVGRIAKKNPFAPADIAAAASSSGINWRRRFVEIGDREIYNRRTTYRGWAGADGDLVGDWKWSLTFGYGEFDGLQIRTNGVNLQRLSYALNATKNSSGQIVCAAAAAVADGCVPINLFGAGSISTAAADYIRANVWYKPTNTQETVDALVNGTLFNLPAGPVEAAFGFSGRRETTKTQTDDLTQTGVTNFAYLAEYSGVIKAGEAFAEMSFPLLRDLPFAYRLSADAAVRGANYNLSGVGQTLSYRVGMQWAPIRAVRFRAEWSRAQRAPDVTELYSPPRDDFDNVIDICSGVTAKTAGVVASNCRLDPGIAATIASTGVFKQGNTNVNSPNAGNANLHEETADTLTAGVVLTPSFAPGLQVSIDYYDIKIDGAIDALDDTNIMLNCYSDPAGIANSSCAAITRDGSGQLIKFIKQVQNLNELRSSGIDVALQYGLSLDRFHAPGRLSLNLRYNRAFKLEENYAGATGMTVDDLNGEVGTSKDTATGRLTWAVGKSRLQWQSRFIGRAVDSNELGQYYAQNGITDPLYQYIHAYWRHDVTFSFTPTDTKPAVRVFGGVRDLFNAYGPFLPTGTNSGNEYNYSPVYSPLGRTYFVGLEASF